MNNTRPEPPRGHELGSLTSELEPIAWDERFTIPRDHVPQLVGLTRVLFGTADSLPAGRWAGGRVPTDPATALDPRMRLLATVTMAADSTVGEHEPVVPRL